MIYGEEASPSITPQNMSAAAAVGLSAVAVGLSAVASSQKKNGTTSKAQRKKHKGGENEGCGEQRTYPPPPPLKFEIAYFFH